MRCPPPIPRVVADSRSIGIILEFQGTYIVCLFVLGFRLFGHLHSYMRCPPPISRVVANSRSIGVILEFQDKGVSKKDRYCRDLYSMALELSFFLSKTKA